MKPYDKHVFVCLGSNCTDRGSSDEHHEEVLHALERSDAPAGTFKVTRTQCLGTREIGSHKGYSLAVMAEILSSVLSGGGAGPFRRAGASHHFIAYKIDAFTDVESFKDDMDAYMTALRESPTAPGHDRVLYAGLPEHEEEIERRAHGIPYHPEVIEWFRSITSELELPQRFD